EYVLLVARNQGSVLYQMFQLVGGFVTLRRVRVILGSAAGSTPSTPRSPKTAGVASPDTSAPQRIIAGLRDAQRDVLIKNVMLGAVMVAFSTPPLFPYQAFSAAFALSIVIMGASPAKVLNQAHRAAAAGGRDRVSAPLIAAHGGGSFQSGGMPGAGSSAFG